MVLVIDIGNTNIVLGGYEGDRLCFTGRCATEPRKTQEEYALTIQGILSLYHYAPEQVEGGIISSVVPALRPVLHQAMERLTGHDFLLVGSGIKTGLRIRTENPAQLGSDLVADAVAAVAEYPVPLVIFDMGTATTVSVVDGQGCYLGGMIVPGAKTASDALSTSAAQLPAITLVKHPPIIGRNTVECMQAGVLYGHAAMVDGLLQRLEETLGAPLTPIATGGLADLVVPLCQRTIQVDPYLQLKGLFILYQKNFRLRR